MSSSHLHSYKARSNSGFLLGLLCCGLLFACSSPAITPENKTQTLTTKPPGHPAWINQPEQDNLNGVVGWAPPQDFGGQEAQYRVALLKARKSLAESIQTRIEVTITQAQKESGKTAQLEAQQKATLRTHVSLQLERAYVAAEWLEPDTGNLYLWLRIRQ